MDSQKQVPSYPIREDFRKTVNADCATQIYRKMS
jgi:hypothetical protein